MRVADVLNDLGLPPIEGIHQLSKTTQEVLPAVTLILKHPQEALDSGAGPWVCAPLPSFFPLIPEDGCKKHMLIYIYIDIYLHFYLSGVESLRRYTVERRSPNHCELRSWGLGWTYGAFFLGASHKNLHDGILFRKWCCIAPVGSLAGLTAPSEGP
jgi:hypothetical protein